jgi:hypothetical protein
MVEVAHGVKVPSCRRQVCAPTRLLADTSAEPRQPNWPSNSLSVWIAPLKEALTLPPHGQWQAGKRL